MYNKLYIFNVQFYELDKCLHTWPLNNAVVKGADSLQ